MFQRKFDKIKKHGFAGVICSPSDIETVNPLAENMLKVCPGIGQNKGQVRTSTSTCTMEIRERINQPTISEDNENKSKRS